MAAALTMSLTAAAEARTAAVQSVAWNYLVDLDHNLQFPQNKQNEQSLTRDPPNGVLIAGANDEISQPLCIGTSTALASPCPFKAGAPTSAYHRSTDGGQSWTGGYLAGFDSIGRTSGGDPALDWGPARCASGAFSTSCGTNIYYGSLADLFGDGVGRV